MLENQYPARISRGLDKFGGSDDAAPIILTETRGQPTQGVGYRFSNPDLLVIGYQSLLLSSR